MSGTRKLRKKAKRPEQKTKTGEEGEVKNCEGGGRLGVKRRKWGSKKKKKVLEKVRKGAIKRNVRRGGGGVGGEQKGQIRGKGKKTLQGL